MVFIKGEKHIRIRHVYSIDHHEEMSCMPTLTYNPALLTPFYFTYPTEGEKDIRISHVYSVDHPAEMPLFINNYLDCLPDDITQYIMDLTKPPSIDDLFCKLTKQIKSPTFKGNIPIDEDVLDYEYYYDVNTDESFDEYAESIIRDYLHSLDDEEELNHYTYWFPNDDSIYDNLPKHIDKSSDTNRDHLYNMIKEQKEYVIQSIMSDKIISYFKQNYVMKTISKTDSPHHNEDIDEMCYDCTAVIVKR